jgi:hypothetical protein
MRELQMWCPAPLLEGELHLKKLRSDNFKPPAGRLLEKYESDSSVEADEDTDAEAVVDLAASVTKSRCRTRSTVAKKSASAVAAAISAVKATEQKKKRKRRAASPPTIATPSILSCQSLKTRLRGGRKVLLRRGSGSWCRRRRRMLSDVVWRRSAVLRWWG